MDRNKVEFEAVLCKITGKSLLCPDNDTKEGDFVMRILPTRVIDPFNKYTYVVTTRGTESVSLKFLERISKPLKITLPVLKLETENQLRKRKVEAMKQKLKEIL